MKIDYKTLRHICLRSIESFVEFGEVFETPDGIYIFKDNGAKILAVAHLDTVLNMNHFHQIEVNGDSVVVNAQLDDRLGAYTLLYLLPSMGIQFDLLLTEGEEQGRSTAAYFETEKQYNWIFSFDRRGEDVVLYQYESKVIKKALQASKFKIGQGTMSDISFMDKLGCKAFNVGCGYHGEHNDMCYANMTQYKNQVKKFADFYYHNKDKNYKHDYTPPVWSVGGSHYTMKDSYLDSAYYSRYIKKESCDLCMTSNAPLQDFGGFKLCDICLGHSLTCESCGDIFFDDEIVHGVCWKCEKIRNDQD